MKLPNNESKYFSNSKSIKNSFIKELKIFLTKEFNFSYKGKIFVRAKFEINVRQNKYTFLCNLLHTYFFTLLYRKIKLP